LNFLLRLGIDKNQITILDRNEVENKIEEVNYDL
jgi:hypothetical protein